MYVSLHRLLAFSPDTPLILLQRNIRNKNLDPSMLDFFRNRETSTAISTEIVLPLWVQGKSMGTEGNIYPSSLAIMVPASAISVLPVLNHYRLPSTRITVEDNIHNLPLFSARPLLSGLYSSFLLWEDRSCSLIQDTCPWPLLPYN